ncbi:hypothetical protein Bca101_088648 [Brassica carinata]
MNRRYSASEKGKGIAPPTDDSGPRRMKASYLDTINLVKENALTLIGHITNPQEQCMWALNPSLPRKWNLRGRAVGSDLGHNCFQYIFDREDDLQSVLDNMPYQFGYWMVILQKWEPVISSSFPSQIPFWIRIKGLPLHYWDARVLCGIGKELGTLKNHVLTKTSAKVRVSIDGIKGLTKDTPNIVEHDRDLTIKALELGKTSTWKEKEMQPHRERRRFPQRTYRTTTTNTKNEHEFRQRVDRHGRPFGERVDTRHARNPPPEKPALSRKPNSRSTTRPKVQSIKEVEVTSPQVREALNNILLALNNTPLAHSPLTMQLANENVKIPCRKCSKEAESFKARLEENYMKLEREGQGDLQELAPPNDLRYPSSR